MKHDRQVIAAFEEAFTPGEEEVVQEVVDAACEAVFAKAAEQFGSEGLYVFGILNPDMGGVSFRFKRPGIRQRVEHFIKCNVPRPPRKKGAEVVDVYQSNENNPDMRVTEQDNEGDAPGSPEDRAQLLRDVASRLTKEQFTISGKPEVSAVNARLPEGVEPFTAAERDQLWS